MMIEANDSERPEMGTMFTVTVDNREYWITAKHLLTGIRVPDWGSVLKTKVSIRVFDPQARVEGWKVVEFSVIDTGKFDVVVLFADRLLAKHMDPAPHVGSSDLSLGDACELLGFPFGLAWRAQFGDAAPILLPFVRHCFVAASSNDGPAFWVLDGLLGPGFAGAPVLFGDGEHQSILGVVSGLLPPSVGDALVQVEPPKDGQDFPSGPPSKQVHSAIQSNLILAYDIQNAIGAIATNPNGPVISGRAAMQDLQLEHSLASTLP